MKVQEITELLRDEIDPKLDRLRQEKRAFLEFQQTQSDVERLTRLVVAHDYVKHNERLRSSKDDLEARKCRAASLEESATKFKNEIACLQEDIKNVKLTREKELRKEGKFQALEDQVKAHSHELVRLNTVLDLKRSNSSEEQNKRQQAAEKLKVLEGQLKQKNETHQKMQERYNSCKEELVRQTQEVDKTEELIQTLQTGVASKEGQQSGYQGQLQDARNRVSAAATEQEQAKLKILHLESRVKEEEPRAKKAKEKNSGLLKDLESLRSQTKKLETGLHKLGFEAGKEEALFEEESKLQRQCRSLTEQADSMRRKVANIDFTYNNPSPNFDRSKVKGLVAQLFSLANEHTRAGTALEICAGGRLYNVVVDTADTGTQLLQNGKLKKRVTIIPLNKISAFRASAEVSFLEMIAASPPMLTFARKLERLRKSRQERLTLL